ncbi:ABC-type Fe3+-hydroxamate transport system, substrate-binding protein [Paenibacillus algorifonticola]|uniref:ABC-type Fe3+-hydroxamate transport system, substrate-binding protein n=1 Tax=Paenibacillus algorifonticola TaxID=684063 RepID=A0A1I2FRS0_9BACL|nr:helix-turn-helix domain-containing protein [Paenibacillus algorifonticola]SFF07703.1 ABC-type Fe3+-hydroxamate transport system, substrate-binding protein [Paenibacillus algorifonticola]
METEQDVLYAFKSIQQLACGPSQPEHLFQTHFHWMLIGMAGAGAVSMERGRMELTPGTAILGSPGDCILQTETENGECRVFFIEFMPLSIRMPAQDGSLVEAGAVYLHMCKHASNASELIALAEQLFSITITHPEVPQRSLTAHMLIQQMMLWWVKDHQAGLDQRWTTEQSVLAALRYMESHYTEALTREQLAEKAGIASTYFSVLCKKVLGLSPSDFLERLRVHRVSELLLQEHGHKSKLDELAHRSGFRDAWYMSKRFRKVQGMSPTMYKQAFVPERIASLENPYTYHFIALGVVPCIARFSSSSHVVIPSDIRSEVTELPMLASIESQKKWLEISKPQLIVTSSMESVQERFRWLAPVVHIPWLTLSWREHLKRIARLVAKEAEAIRYIEALDQQAKRLRQKLQDIVAPGTTVSLFKIENNRCYLYGIRDAGCIFYEFLGLLPHPVIQQHLAQDPNFHSMEISMRQMADFAGDINFIILVPNVSKQNDLLRMNEHWRQFELKNERSVIYLDYREWLHYDPVHIADQLTKVLPLFQ